MGKIWSVCSGSGGVGRTTVALSIAAGAAKAGKKTILLDASGVSRSCDLVLGLESVMTLDMVDVFSGQIDIQTALYPVQRYPNLSLACISLRDPVPVSQLSFAVLTLHSLCDILVIDMPAGQGDLGRGILRSGDERLFVVRPDSASIRAAERVLAQNTNDPASLGLILNRFSRDRIKRKTQYSQDVVQSLLDIPVLACIPEDSSIPECECRGLAAIECNGPAWTALSRLTESLLANA